MVDYQCRSCGGRTERLVRSPAPPTATCPACRSVAGRRFSPVGLVGRAAPPAGGPSASAAPALCQTNPDVPGLCHMTPEAGRTWVARARKDNRSLERELERQETAIRDHPGTVPEPASHDHGSSHGHSHGHAHAGTASPSSNRHPTPPSTSDTRK